MSCRSDFTGGPARNARADRETEVDVHELLSHRRQVAIVWCVEDVQHVRPDLSAEQAWEVLQHIRCHHDASLGVCWETLTFAADALFPEPEEKP